MVADAVMRRLILSLAGSSTVGSLIGRYGMALGAARFVAGEDLAQAVAAVERLNGRGLKVTLDHLGESVADRAAARSAAHEYIQMLDAIAARGLDANASLKLTQMGLDIDADFCLDNVRRIVQRAAGHGNFVRIDMEDSPRVEVTLSLLGALMAEGFQNVGPVVQSCLYRTPGDVDALIRAGVTNIRIVKGAYLEPPAVAYPQKARVDAAYVALVKQCLAGGCYPAVATHDQRIVRQVLAHVQQAGIGRQQFEFQMLYGIRPALQEELARQGYTVRVYVPYGKEWYPYFMRRLAERPANLLFFLRGLLSR